MKFTQFRLGKFYKRESDGSHFKVDERKRYLKVNGKGQWEVTEDLALNDDFIIHHQDEGVVTFEDMFNQYRSGDIEVQKNNHDKLLLGMARALDEIRRR